MRRFSQVALVAMILLAGLTVRAEDWPMLGCDPQRSNYTPEAIGGYVSYPQWTQQWTWRTDSPIPWRAQVVAAEGIAAIGTYDGKLHAIDLATGKEKWTFPTGGPILHSPAIVAGKVYIASQDGVVVPSWNRLSLRRRITTL